MARLHMSMSVLLVLICPLTLSLALHSTEVDFETLAEDLNKVLGCHRNPGMAVSIVKDGKTVFSKGFGVTNEVTKTNVTSDTLFDLASLTKAFTAALLVDVIATNESVDWGATIHEIVGGDFQFGDPQRSKYATVEDLLSHRIDLTDRLFLRFNTKIQRQDYIRLANYFTSKYQFRSKAHYANINYVLAGALVEIIGGKKWEDLMQERIFKPLGMMSSTFTSAVNFKSPNVAHLLSTYGPRLLPIDPKFTRNWESLCGASCIFSSAHDIAEWMKFHLSLGQNSHGQQIFPSPEVKSLHLASSLMISSINKVSKPTFPESNFADAYGLGWRLGEYRGYSTLYHTGSDPGSASQITLFPSENVGVFTSMRGDDVGEKFRLPLHNYISDIMLHLKPWLNVSTICTFPEPWIKAKHTEWPIYDNKGKPTHDITKYVGSYKNKLYGTLDISFNSSFGGLQATYGFGQWHLHQMKKADEFYGKGQGVVDFLDVYPFKFESSSSSSKISTLTVGGTVDFETVVFLKDPGTLVSKDDI